MIIIQKPFEGLVTYYVITIQCGRLEIFRLSRTNFRFSFLKFLILIELLS